MRRSWVAGSAAAIASIAALSWVGDGRGDVLYSTIAGATTAGSSQPTYSASLTLSENVNNAGPVGFGDDYTSASPGLTGAQINSGAYPNAPTDSQLNSSDSYVQLSSLSYYGDLEPGPNGSVTTLRNGTQLYSEGGNVDIRFYDSSGVLVQQADISAATATSASGTGTLTPSAVQGPGLHMISLSSPLYIPASGYFVITPYLASSYSPTYGVSTPTGTVGVSLTGYFGAAPTVGTGNASFFTTITSNPNDPSGNSSQLFPNSTFANIQGQSPDTAGDVFTYTPSTSGNADPSTGYYFQVELDGSSLVPEPCSFAVFAFGACFFCGRRPLLRRMNSGRSKAAS
jgi:hypothetical protein